MIRQSLVACVALSVFAVAAVHAQDHYPSKPIKFVVGYSPGGSNDILARIVAKRLGDSLGQPVIVDNRPSTGAIVGAVVTKQAAPDGYTLMIGASGPLVINAAIYSNLPYSPQKDFVPISTIATFPLIVSVKSDAPFKSMPDLVKYTKENPQLSNYASSSSTFQLATELLKERTGILSQHVPYKGSGDSMKSVAGGETTFSMLDPGPASGAVNGKLLRGLAVSSDVRNPAFPDVPTFKEQGIDLSIQFWIGLFAPAGTPAPVVKLLEREVAKAVQHPETLKSMAQLGLTPAFNTPEAFARQIAQEIPTWTEIARKNNIKADQ
jgi:tripartite-type tricarboxylate transporter receptor subunit TctC